MNTYKERTAITQIEVSYGMEYFLQNVLNKLYHYDFNTLQIVNQNWYHNCSAFFFTAGSCSTAVAG